MAYAELESRSARGRPLARHYYELFSSLGARDPGWQQVRHVVNLRPGDVLSWKYSHGYKARHGIRSTGHTMIVMAQAASLGVVGGYSVVVSDSALHPHSHDSRRRGESGIGVGTIRLDVDERDRPVAFHRALDAQAEGDLWIAAARPRQ